MPHGREIRVVELGIRSVPVACPVVRCAPGLLTGHMNELPSVRAARIPVTGTYHGVDVTEDYQWLEDASAQESMAWTKAQQARTRVYFDAIPWRDALRGRVEQLLKAERTTYKRLVSGGSIFFALKEQTPRQQPFLVALTGLDDPGAERVVVDPNAIDPSGETSIDFSCHPRTASRSPSRCRSTATRTGRCMSMTSAAGLSSASRSRM